MKDKIIIIARSLPMHNSGGLEIVTWDMCKGLSRRGLDIEILTTKFPHGTTVEDTGNINIIEIEDTRQGRYSYNWWRRISSHLENKRGENIHAVISVSAAGYSVLKHKNIFPEAKFIMQAHGTSLDELKTKLKSYSPLRMLKGIKNAVWLIKDIYYYRKFDYIVTIGDAVLHSISSRPYSYFIDLEKVIKIENGVDDELFNFNPNKRDELRSKLGINDDTFVIVSVCRLHEQKGIDNNLRMLKILKKNNQNIKLKYIVVGDGPAKNNLKSLTYDLDVKDIVCFVGDQTRDNIADYLSVADLFLFLTKRIEGLPLNVLEAQCSGLPIILSEHLSFAEGNNMFKVRHDDHIKAANVASKIISNINNSTRSSYINEVNKLSYSTSSYLELINRE
ncbi:glycosyltransferase family 4 protein [Klebsiella indica]|uniref:Glycosyltransferase family 4 protein n=1 Tax=Klebsiella indica TaxID=2582917 RepID=A0A5R9LKV4_9ENTR|nr:glycosyltransferase family 4 protein [Klebsiella indica]TLV21529.1 glycosyltransferase family 4 protein [Klebsiella indica]